MRMALLALALTAVATSLSADETKAPLATVRLGGSVSDVSEEKLANGKTSSSGTLTTPAGLKCLLTSTSSLQDLTTKAAHARLDLLKEQREALLKMLKEQKKGKGRDKALDRLKAEFKSRERSPVIAEGSLAVADKTLRLSGVARLLDSKKLDKDLPAGGAMVEGEAEMGKFPLGQDGEATLAIKNGAAPIYVTGKAVGDETRKGKLRVYGHLKQGDKGALVLEATKIEEVK